MFTINAMRQLTINNLTKPRSKIPKSLIVFFLIAQFFFGLDFGFAAIVKKKNRTLAQQFTFWFSIFYVIVVFAPFTYVEVDFWSLINAIEFTSSIIFLNTSKYTVYNFLNDIHEVYEVKKSEENVLKIIAFVYLVVMYLIKGGLVVVERINAEVMFSQALNIWHLILFHIACAGLDCLAITRVVIYYYFQCCAKHLNELLAKSATNINIVERKYIVIADCYDKIRNFNDKMTILELGTGVPKMMIDVWWMLLKINESREWNSIIVSELIFSGHVAIQIALPAITMEMVNSRMESLKLLLNEYLRSEKDEKLISDMVRVLRYMNTRQLNHRVLRFIPIDLTQLLSVFSLCATYFIVIIQFAHMYD